VKRNSLAPKRARRLKKIENYLISSPDKADYFDISEIFGISPSQARNDLSHLILKKPSLLDKIFRVQEEK